MEKTYSYGVIGGGAWGTALACVLARRSSGANDATQTVKLWAREAETVESINRHHENRPFLANIRLPENIVATSGLTALADCDIILMVAPAQFARPIIAQLAPLLSRDTSLVLCAKGVERGSLKFMSQMAEEYVPATQIAVLSGPSFAADVARGMPTAVTLACADAARGHVLCQAIGSAGFRPYLSGDIIGAEIGGAIKNVLAIACGIVIGKGLGESARAATTARGFVEMQRLGMAMGAQAETLAGLSGLGDLILTCASLTSRNFSLGHALGEGQKAEDILGQRASVSEGAMSAEAVRLLAEIHGLDMPICLAVDNILAGRESVDTAIENLLARPFTAEGTN